MESEKVAILVDGGFYQRRAKRLWGERTGPERADELFGYCQQHLRHRSGDYWEYDSLYRIFYYDCPPAEKNVYHPFLKKDVCLKKTPLHTYMTSFLEELKTKRKVALRLGRLSDNDLYYALTKDAQKMLLRGTISVSDLKEEDFTLNISQKGVDMRLGLDIASMAYKKQVTRIILISGDSDFVPAAKLARREGIDFLLDPMGASISPDLSEHVDGIQSKIKHDPLERKQSKTADKQ